MITATISTYNRERYLPQVLESLKNQTLSKELFEIVLVNNNSPGNTEEISSQFQKDNPQLKYSYHLETSQGLSYGRNKGIEQAKGEYVTFIDDDAFLKEDYLEKIYNYFEGHEDVVAIGSKILLHYEDVVPDWGNKYLNPLLGYFNLGDEYKIFSKNNYPRGSNMSFRMSLFEKVGRFNVDLGRKAGNLIASEEKDLFNRIYQHKDLKVAYIPDAIVYHCVPLERTTTEFIKRQALGTGISERLRTKSEGVLSYLKRGGSEIYKWGGSIVLSILFILKGQKAKGVMILKFRWWVSKGFIFKIENK